MFTFHRHACFLFPIFHLFYILMSLFTGYSSVLINLASRVHVSLTCMFPLPSISLLLHPLFTGYSSVLINLASRVHVSPTCMFPLPSISLLLHPHVFVYWLFFCSDKPGIACPCFTDMHISSSQYLIYFTSSCLSLFAGLSPLHCLFTDKSSLQIGRSTILFPYPACPADII